MTLPTLSDWIFAIKVCVAALLALFLAQWIDLPRPYWAVSTVFITAQPLTGATRSKALYRVLGTLLGAVAAVIIVPNLVNAPEVMTLAVALWVSFCLYFSLLDRTPRSYTMMLAGYTTAFIGFPAVDQPGTIFDVAVSRAEEIILGILCASLVMTLVLPQSAAPGVKSRLTQWFNDARNWSADMLARREAADSSARSWRLGSDAAAFDALVTPLRHDLSGAERSAETLATLRQHMLMFLPVVSAIADRIKALESLGPLPDKVARCLDTMSQWIASGTTEAHVADEMRSAVAAIDPPLARTPQWVDLLVANLAARLRSFIDLRQDSRALQRHIMDGTPMREALAFPYTARARTIRHRDHGIAFLSAFAAFLAIIIASTIWIGTKWPDGNAAPMLAAVGCCFFAAQDDPATNILGLANGAIVGGIGAGILQFGILPRATEFEMLALALAPVMILSSILMTKPRTQLLGMGMSVIGFTLLALEENYTGDFSSFANLFVAAILGVWIAAITTRLVRSVGAAWTARRLRRTNRNDLVEAAVLPGEQDQLELAALMLDRLGLIAPRLTALPAEDAEWTKELLTEVRIGIDVVGLRRVRRHVSRETAREFETILQALARHFSTDALRPPPELLANIDTCMESVAKNEEDPLRRDVLLALVDLRRGLFPGAEPYRPSAPETLEPELAA